MTFDEQLQRSLATLSDRVRDELARVLVATGAEVAAHANEARDAAVHEASARAREEAEGRARIELQRLELQVQEMATAAAAREQRHATDVAAGERLVAAVRTIDRAASLSEILDRLVDCASREAARVGLLLARNGELRGWRFAGFGPSASPAGSILIRAEESGMIGEAVRTGAAVSSNPAEALAIPAFAQGQGDLESVAVPLIVSGDVAVVLYADRPSGGDAHLVTAPLTWSDMLELLARHAARCLEAATAIKAVHLLTDPPDIPESASSTVLAGATMPSIDGDRQAEPDLQNVELNT
jgi:hypothetical protein